MSCCETTTPPILQEMAPIQPLHVEQINSTTAKTQEVATKSLHDRMLEAGNSFEALAGKEIDAISFSKVDMWLFSLICGISEGSLPSVKKYLGYVSHLCPENQIALLSEAKNLAKNIVDTVPTDTTNEDNILLSIFTFIDEKLQECQKSNPDISPKLPLDIKKEKVLKEILKKDALESEEKSEANWNESINRSRLSEYATFAAFLLSTVCVAKGSLFLGLATAILATDTVYRNTIVLLNNGNPPTVMQKILAGYEANFNYWFPEVSQDAKTLLRLFKNPKPTPTAPSS